MNPKQLSAGPISVPKHYADAARIAVALDCIIFGFNGEELKLLLVKRSFEPERGKWSLVGGFLHENEDLEEAARRILYELTGLQEVFLEQLQTFGAINRDPVERTISVVYYSLINLQNGRLDVLPLADTSWVKLAQKPPLIFDHNQMVELALTRLRYKAALHPLGFELLPDTFTVPQVQKLYEAIYNMPLDRRNFSRKMLATGLLVCTGEKDKRSSTKKGTLYRLDKERYTQYWNAFSNFVPVMR